MRLSILKKERCYTGSYFRLMCNKSLIYSVINYRNTWHVVTDSKNCRDYFKFIPYVTNSEYFLLNIVKQNYETIQDKDEGGIL